MRLRLSARLDKSILMCSPSRSALAIFFVFFSSTPVPVTIPSIHALSMSFVFFLLFSASAAASAALLPAGPAARAAATPGLAAMLFVVTTVVPPPVADDDAAEGSETASSASGLFSRALKTSAGFSIFESTMA